MRIHHLDCCTLCPVGGPPIGPERMVGHCLLVETPADGLVLVDTGIGLLDVRSPAQRLGVLFTAITRPVCDEANTAAAQVARLGFARTDVRHVIVTHLDLDHAGGLPDFPAATVHVHAREREVALAQRTLQDRSRYRPCQWSHGPRWGVYEDTDGEPWMGLPAVRALPGLPPEILAVPTPGHSLGHAAIAVRRADGRWLLHAGDAYFAEASVHEGGPPMAPALRTFERLVAADRERYFATQARLRELQAEHRDDVVVFSAHDAGELERLRAS